MVLAIGGDGTLLRAAEQARPLSAPILGINLGRVGFLTEVDVDHVDAALQAIIDQRYRVSSRMTVQVSVEHEGRVRHRRVGAQRDQRREGHPGEDSRRRGGGRRARGVRLRLRRRAVRDADRVHRLHLLGRRPGALAGRRRAARRPVERARPVRPIPGGVAGIHGHRAHRPGRPQRHPGLRRAADARDPARFAGARVQGREAGDAGPAGRSDRSPTGSSASSSCPCTAGATSGTEFSNTSTSARAFERGIVEHMLQELRIADLGVIDEARHRAATPASPSSPVRRARARPWWSPRWG